MTSFGGSAPGHARQPAPSVAGSSPLTVAVLTDSPAESGRIVDALAHAGHSVQLAPAVDESVDLVVADFDAGGLDVLQALDEARSAVPAIPFLVMSGPLGADVAVDHVKRGVSDWILKDGLERLPRAVDQAIRHRIAADEEARAIEALRDNERRLARAQHVAHVGSWEWDPVADTVVWSGELYQMYGRDPAAFTPSYANFLDCVVDEDRPRVEATIESVFRSQGPFELEFRIDRPDGTVRALACRGDVEFGRAGRHVAAARRGAGPGPDRQLGGGPGHQAGRVVRRAVRALRCPPR